MESRVLILAPHGRDAEVAATLFRNNGIEALICADLAALVVALETGAGGVMVTEEVLAASDTRPLMGWIAAQPAWSDLAFIVLANGNRGPRSEPALARLQALGSTVLLERPLHAEAMLGTVRSTLKARSRQYEVRDFAKSLENAVRERTAQLEEARDSLQVALDAAEMGSWDIDLVSGIARRTLRHDQIFGYENLATEWSVEAFLAHVDPEQRDKVAAQFEAAPTVGFIDFECEIITESGQRRWIAAKGRMRYNPVGQAIRMTGVVADITERKEADAQLAQAHKMDAIGQLTGGVAHDFNNLLTPIVGSLDLLRHRCPEDEKSQRLINVGLQAAARAATLTQRLLAFARRQALQPQSVDVGVLVEGMSDLLERSLGPTITIVYELPRHLPPVRVDPNQLELALLNLAINARDAMAGGGKLTITASNNVVEHQDALSLEAGRYVCITASDTGIGMDKATLARATEPFFSTKGMGKGTGLGLSMIHGLAAQSGGALQIDSVPGQGTAITIWLPTTAEAALNVKVDAPQSSHSGKAAKLLIVDDEEIVRIATAEMLRDVGYDVVEATSGSQALALITGGIEVDVIVTDYLMPGMNGAQLIEELRSRGYEMPVLLITGYAAKGEDVPAGVPLLAKPFRQADLASNLADLFHRSKQPPKLKVV